METAKIRPPFSFLIVNFRSRGPLEECLASIRKNCPESEREIIIINNEPETLALSGPDIRIIASPENVGFGKAMNVGAQTASGEFIFFINPDARLESFPYQAILSRFHSDPDLQIIGAAIRTVTGNPEPWSKGPPATLWNILRNNLLPWKKEKVQEESEMPVGWVSGSGMIVRRSAFEHCGGFDESFFLYFEDMDLAARIRKKGGKVLFFPGLRVIHSGGESFRNTREQKEYYYRSQDRYLRKHRGRLEASIARILRKLFHP